MPKMIPKFLAGLMLQPDFTKLTMLCLEKMNLETVFVHIKECKQIQALYLAGNHVITKDLKYMIYLPKLRKIDLSSNRIYYLPKKEDLEANLKHLEFVLLHKNQISGWENLQNIIGLPSVRHLTLQGNPCAKILGSRE